MIKGFLDNDLYKFTMQQAVWRYYGGHDCEYTLINRGKAYEVNDAFISEFRTQLEKLTKLRLTPAERRYLNSLPYFDDDYLNMLEKYRFDPAEVNWNVDSNNHLSLKVKGLWNSAILWEVPLLEENP